MKKPFFLRALDACKGVKVTPRDKLVFAYLATRQGDNGHAWPSERTMVRDLGVGRATLLRAIDNLCQAGLVAKTSGRPGRGHSNQYEVNLSKSAHGGPFTPQQKAHTVDPLVVNKSAHGETRKAHPGGAETSRKTSSSKRRKTKPLISPTAQEVEDYAESLGYTNFHRGQKFVDTYAPDWIDTRGKPVKDWKAKLRNVWLRDLKKPERGDPDWLPTEEEVQEILNEC